MILQTTIDSVEYFEIMNWLYCYVWFAHGNTFKYAKVTFKCDELPNYLPQSLQPGDNINVCFYIYSDGSFGSNVKGFSQNENTVSLEDIYSSFKENCAPLDWESIMRSPENAKGTTYTFTGNVFQVVSEENGWVELLLSTNNEDQYVYVTYRYKENDLKFLENDTLTVYGTFNVTYKYKSVLGSQHSVPKIAGQFIELVQ